MLRVSRRIPLTFSPRDYSRRYLHVAAELNTHGAENGYYISFDHTSARYYYYYYYSFTQFSDSFVRKEIDQKESHGYAASTYIYIYIYG